MKRTITLILSALTVLSLMCGCTVTQNTGTPATAQTGTGVQDTRAATLPDNLDKWGRPQVDSNIPEDKIGMISNTCKFMLLGLFLQFIWDKMTLDIDETVDTFSVMMEDFLKTEIDRFSI